MSSSLIGGIRVKTLSVLTLFFVYNIFSISLLRPSIAVSIYTGSKILNSQKLPMDDLILSFPPALSTWFLTTFIPTP